MSRALELSAEAYDAHCLGTIIDLRRVMRAARLTHTASALEAIQAHTRISAECDLCYGTKACEHGDEYRDCFACRGADGLPRGVDPSVPVGRIYDHRAPNGEKLSCPICLDGTASETKCEHCGQCFATETAEDGTALTLEELLRRSIKPASEAA